MNEKKKLYIMLGVVVGIVVLTLGVYIADTIATNKLLKDIDEKMNGEEVQIFYLSRPTCHYCALLEPVTETLKAEYGLTYYHINTDQYNKTQLNKILAKFDVDPKDFGTPYIAITKSGKIVEELNGYADENIVFELFQRTGIIPEDASLAFEYIDYATFQNLWNSEEKQLIMIGATGKESVEARNILKSFIKNYHLNIKYMDVVETGNNETYSAFLQMIGHTNQTTFPILMIIQNKTVLAETNQGSTDAYEAFLKENGVI